MSSEDELRARLRKIEALFAGAGTPGERAAAGAALERIRARLGEARKRTRAIEMQFSIADSWSRQLFVALARRYDLRPYRHARQRRTTVMLQVPEAFVRDVLWPEFEQLNAALVEYLAEVTARIIREEVHREAGEAEERPDPSGGYDEPQPARAGRFPLARPWPPAPDLCREAISRQAVRGDRRSLGSKYQLCSALLTDRDEAVAELVPTASAGRNRLRAPSANGCG